MNSNRAIPKNQIATTSRGSVVPFVGMLTGEVTPGGVGVGLDGPARERAVRRLHRRAHDRANTGSTSARSSKSNETKLIVLLRLLSRPALLGFTAASMFVGSVLHTTMWNSGTHGFSESILRLQLGGQNTVLAFAGITANTQWMNTVLGLAMLVGWFFLIIPVLAIAGSLARKPAVPTTSGTLERTPPCSAGSSSP